MVGGQAFYSLLKTIALFLLFQYLLHAAFLGVLKWDSHLPKEFAICFIGSPFKNYAENEAGRLVPDLFLFFKNA